MTRTPTITLSAHSLAAVELFADLPAAARATLAQAMPAHRYAPGEVVFAQDDSSRDVHFIVSGRARATYYSGLGKEIAFLDLTAGTSFGELAALDDGPRSARVEVLEAAVIARMAQDAFLALLAREPLLARAVMRGLACAVRRLSDRVIEFSTIGVAERLQAELLRLARAGEVRGNRATVRQFPTHAELATRISTHREAVTRELSRLRKAGLCGKVQRRVLVFEDLAGLTARVESARREGATISGAAAVADRAH
ncbi:MAG: Crp/Fnr family transcriptional regulator [Gammaproteobacteria bacterium]